MAQPEHDRSRPAGNQAASNVINGDPTSVAIDRRAYRRRRWAFERIQRAEQPVVYGSDEWLALDDSDPVKIAAVCIAAECWARDGEDIAGRLAQEVDRERRAYKATDDALYVARKEQHAKEWRHLKLVRGAYADTAEFLNGGAQ